MLHEISKAFPICLFLCGFGPALFAQNNNENETNVGQFDIGGKAYFTRNNASGEWGIEVSGTGTPLINQAKPVKLEILRADNGIFQLTSGYKTVEKFEMGWAARADIPYASNIVFQVNDYWSVTGAVLSVRRTVEVSGNAPGGFGSAIVFDVDPAVNWTNVNGFIPGALYGDTTYNGERSPCGTMNYATQRFTLREDVLPAPLLGLSFANGASVTALDPTPRGDSTVGETKLTNSIMTDARFQFGAFGLGQTNGGPMELSFTYPGTVSMNPPGPVEQTQPRWIRRYHPIQPGVTHSYEVSFRFGQNETLRDVEKNSWRWAWATLKPAVYYLDVEQMRRVLIDHLESQAATIDGRTAIPFAAYTLETNKPQWNWTMAEMGFVAKNIECADQLLREGDRDPGERGQKMRATGLGIISSMIHALPTVPLAGTGYDLATGKPWTGEHPEWLAPWLRQATEDMRVLMRAYRRERALGRQHPEWFAWVKQYADWLIQQQRDDGSFPRRWKEGSNEVAEPTGTTSYCPVPLLVIMSEETGDAKYQQSATRAAEYVWNNFGSRGLFVGGASDNPNITDKEAGMLSMEAFLSLYDATKDGKWLERAQAAANYAETYIWIWNLPMPLDAEDSQLHYKKGVPTTGVQGITARGPGGADEYLDWATSSYAKLYKLTHDEHYLEVARVLLHDTKSMVAMPGRQYDMRGPGWQQEGWGMGPGRNGRGVGGHRFWLPWVSANHLWSITGLEELDPALFKLISTKPADQK